LVPALVVRQGASHTVGRELRVSDYVVPAIVELRIAVQDADDFMPDHLQRLFFVGWQALPSERLAEGLL
jgi:hypothetical protein